MDDDVLKRVASAICVALAGEHVDPDATVTVGPPNEIGAPMWKFYEKAALAAVEAYTNSALSRP